MKHGSGERIGLRALPRVELRALRRLTAGLVHHRAPALSPDGQWLCLQTGEGEEAAWLLCDRHGRPARVLPGPAEGAAAFSAEHGLGLAYGRRIGATCEIWLLSAGDGTPHLLFGGDGRLYRDPAFSPDGQRVCYAADAPDGETLLLEIAELGGSTRRVLPSPGGADGATISLSRPAFCPEGRWLYCEGHTGQETAIYALLPDSGDVPRRLTPPGLRARRPTPLLPGLLVCECEDDDGTSALFLLRFDPTGAQTPRLRQIDDDGRGAREPAVVWRKGQARLVCALSTEVVAGEPARYDLYVGRLAGLRREAAP